MKLIHEVRVTEEEIVHAVGKYVASKTHTNLPGITFVVTMKWRAKKAVVELRTVEVPTLTEVVRAA